MRVPARVALATALVGAFATAPLPAPGGIAIAQTPAPTLTAATLSGTVPTLPDGATEGTLEVFVEEPSASATTTNPAPDEYSSVFVTSVIVQSGANFTINVPMTTDVAATSDSDNGYADFELDFVSGAWQSTTFATANVRYTGSGADDPAGSSQPLGTSDFSAFAPANSSASAIAASPTLAQAATTTSATPDVIIPIMCHWVKDSTSESLTRLGELHVVNATGATGTFEYNTQADSVLSVGLSYNGGTTWSASGSATASNSIGTTGHMTRGAGYLRYVQGHLYYGHYHQENCASYPPTQMVKVTSAVGDVSDGTNVPPANPYGSCHADPYGLGFEPAHGGWASDTGRAVSYNVAASLWGFGFNGHTGYSKNIKIDLENSSSNIYYFCGTKYLPNVPVLYNSTS